MKDQKKIFRARLVRHYLTCSIDQLDVEQNAIAMLETDRHCGATRRCKPSTEVKKITSKDPCGRQRLHYQRIDKTRLEFQIAERFPLSRAEVLVVT